MFFQYTILEGAGRERFSYTYKEQSSFATVAFVKRAIDYYYLDIFPKQSGRTMGTNLLTPKRRSESIHLTFSVFTIISFTNGLAPKHRGTTARRREAAAAAGRAI